MEGLIYGGKFAFQNRLGLFVVGRKFIIFFFVLLCIRGQIPSTSPPGAYIRGGDLTEGFLRYDFGELIFGGAYFRNFTVLGALRRFRSSSFLGRMMLMLVFVIYLVFVT